MNDTHDVFAERLLQVIDEGRRTATYKLALLLALIDACAAGADRTGHAPHSLHTRTVARHVLRLYLPQVRLYLGADGKELELRQITTKKSAALGAVLRMHSLGATHRCRTATDIARRFPEEYEHCLDEVERTFARYPLRLLQVVGHDDRPFLYDIDWGQSVSLRSLHADGGGLIQFRAGAGDHLLRLAPLVRPLIELHWSRMVAYQDSDLLFCKENGEPLHPQTFTQAFDRLIAKIAVPTIRLHDLRHTHATIALRADIPPKVIAERLGHESPAFTLKQYAHVTPGMQAEAAAQIAALVRGTSGPGLTNRV